MSRYSVFEVTMKIKCKPGYSDKSKAIELELTQDAFKQLKRKLNEVVW